MERIVSANASSRISVVSPSLFTPRRAIKISFAIYIAGGCAQRARGALNLPNLVNLYNPNTSAAAPNLGVSAAPAGAPRPGMIGVCWQLAMGFTK
jgi:hypothetical protein